MKFIKFIVVWIVSVFIIILAPILMMLGYEYTLEFEHKTR